MNFNIIILLSFFVLASSSLLAQNEEKMMDKEMEELPYTSIPDHAESFTATGVAARMIDGLGFRYRWATEFLREEDLPYQPDSTARSCDETLDHILGLTEMIVNAVENQPNVRPSEEKSYTLAEKREHTLANIKRASDILWAGDGDELSDYKIIFQRGDKVSEFPFWNLINGPVSDALWHCGQIVSFRRAAGNPMPSGVSVFSGRVRGQ